VPAFRRAVLQHKPEPESEFCLLCELLFLYRMLMHSNGTPCRASNLLRALGQVPGGRPACRAARLLRSMRGRFASTRAVRIAAAALLAELTPPGLAAWARRSADLTPPCCLHPPRPAEAAALGLLEGGADGQPLHHESGPREFALPRRIASLCRFLLDHLSKVRSCCGCARAVGRLWALGLRPLAGTARALDSLPSPCIVAKPSAAATC
jgi:hypothetical protein